MGGGESRRTLPELSGSSVGWKGLFGGVIISLPALGHWQRTPRHLAGEAKSLGMSSLVPFPVLCGNISVHKSNFLPL